jgi:hypothetical protein
MIAEGLSLALVAWCLSALALAFGVYLGGRGLIDPLWAQRLVRLKADEQGGGFAEFRAVYGGLFLASHLTALAFALLWIVHGDAVVGTIAIGANAVMGAAWGGAGLGRVLSLLRDEGVKTRFNRVSVVIELAMAALIGAPWLVWMLGAGG